MTIDIALKYFLISLIFACAIGLSIRAKQEKIHPSFWYLVIFVYFFNFIFDLLVPFIVCFRFLFGINKSKYPLIKRIKLALLSIPVGYYDLIMDNDTFSHEKFWKPFITASIKLRKNLNQNKMKITKSQVRKHSSKVLLGFEKKISELIAY